ncbi:hypothetical protein [Methylobacterium sp. WSM2598]|uniref:hypothetical protein n=1 Tax=Methylobacterium sp. WSM2598 TaxID=398261 RepID=UPI0003694829|nr:hypothetical protein [Methylobacterium sp. WSM2598]
MEFDLYLERPAILRAWYMGGRLRDARGGTLETCVWQTLALVNGPMGDLLASFEIECGYKVLRTPEIHAIALRKGWVERTAALLGLSAAFRAHSVR